MTDGCPKLADVLISLGCNADALKDAAGEFYRDQRFGEYLLSLGLCTPSQLALALAQQATIRGDYARAQALVAEAAKAVHKQFSHVVEAFRVAGVELSTVGES